MPKDASSAEPREAHMVRGIVVSDKMDKTIVVKSERLVMHPRYKKYLRKFTKYHAHDEDNTAKIGDTVELSEARPLSKSKRWQLTRVLSTNELARDGGVVQANEPAEEEAAS